MDPLRSQRVTASVAVATASQRPTGDPSFPVGDTCRLLGLPPELRELIFELVVTRNGPINMRPRPWIANGTDESQLQQPALTATCKQIRRESLGLFYSLNTFEQTFEIGGSIDDGRSVATYLDAIGVDMCKCLRKVHLLFIFRFQPTSKNIMPWIELFNRASLYMPRPGVFQLESAQGSWERPELLNLKLADDLMKDLEAFGWHLHDEGQLRPTFRTRKGIKIALRQWFVKVGNVGCKGFMKALEHDILHHFGCQCIPEKVIW